MVKHTGQDLRGSRFTDSDLRHSSFREVDMRGTHFRGAFLMDAEIDGEIEGLRINGVEVEPLVEAELGLDAEASPSYAEVLEARAGRVAMVRDYLSTVTAEDLSTKRGRPPWEPTFTPTVRESIGVICNEEWQHHRFAVRDLDAIEAGRA